MTAGSLEGIVSRTSLERMPASKIPWHDAEFSQRMLREHLDQRHDHASRRLQTIDAHVEWLFDSLLGGSPGSVLDLGCGPGLYCERLAARGCRCLGVDISPASIEYATRTAAERGIDCTYVCDDVTDADLGCGHDLAMLLFGELNTFPRPAIAELLRRVWAALRPGGTLALEVHTYESVAREGRAPSGWWTSEGGLFSPGPHIVLHEQRWIEETATTASRSFVLAAGTGDVEVYSESLSAYTNDEYQELLHQSGFARVQFHSTFGRVAHPDFAVITAIRQD